MKRPKRSRPYKPKTRGGRREITLTPETEAMLVTIADLEKMSVSALIRMMIREKFSKLFD